MSTPGEGGITCHEISAVDALKDAYRASSALVKLLRWVPAP